MIKYKRERDEREQPQNKSVMRRVYDAMLGDGEFKEERYEMLNRRQQIEVDEDDENEEVPVEKI